MNHSPTPRILVVEDESSIAILLKQMLEGFGYAVPAMVMTGRDAIKMAGELRPDVVLMDILLGGDLDGVGAAEQIRASYDIPVVYVTGYGDDNTIQRAKMSRPSGFLLKPVKERELRAAIEIALFRSKEKPPAKDNQWSVHALRNMVDPVIVTDDRGHVAFMNQPAEAATGWVLSDAKGQPLTEIFNVKKEATANLTDSSVTAAFRDQAVLMNRTQEKVPIDYSVGMIRDDAGKSSGFIVTFRDITQRQRMEEVLRESRRKYKELVNSIEGIVWEADGETHRFFFVSKQAQRMFGYQLADWINDPDFWKTHVDPADRDWAINYSQRSTHKKKDFLMEYRMLDREGHTVWVRDIVNVIAEEGAPVKLRGVMIDITKLKHAEEALRRAHDDLEKRVQERTAELSEAVEKLRTEIEERQRVEAALLASEQKYRTLVEGMSEGMVQVNSKNIIEFVNDRFCELTGLSRNEVLGNDVTDVLFRYMPEEQQPAFQALSVVQELPLRRRSGGTVWVRISGAPMVDSRGEVIGSIGIITDITVRREAEEALRESEERYALAARGANDGLWDWNLKTNEVYYSPRWKEMLGWDEGSITQSPDEWFRRVNPDDVDRVKSGLATHLEGLTPHFENEHRMLHRDGTYRWMLTRGVAVRDANNKASRLAGSQTDITERKLAEEQLLHDAFHDALTNLSNRALFMDRLAGAVARARRREDYLFAVLFLDVDRFKVVNDSLGHIVGDLLLIAIARRLEICLRPGDTVARLGGDEFAILLEDISDVSDSIRVAERIQKELQYAFNLSGYEVFATASIGIAPGSSSYERAEDILRDADTAMYRAKALGRSRHQVFDKAMHARAVALLQLETDLRRAVERNEFRLYYQPIVSFHSGKVYGFEALIRWLHPEKNIISPAEFIPIAEETGLIIPIGRWVLREACRQMKEWQHAYPNLPPLTVSVNLSGKQLSQPDLIQDIKSILSETGLDPSYLELEITESVIMENAEHAAEMLAQLRALRVQINVDDFGTGYSSLSYLHRFPVNNLKIDQSFVSRIGVDEENSEIISTILTLARNLGLDVIAEGVETKEQLVHLQDLGCEQGQGFYFSVPVDHKGAAMLIENMESIESPGPLIIPAGGARRVRSAKKK
ncbi:MAG TPA: EAL domain-containing protein [Acidobacteriota bacterium]|nr:EAL domain-containing protein [Acidobacteriota bacterium]